QLAGVVVQLAREGYQGEIGGVEHQLDRQEDADAVAPRQRADGADGEQQSRQHQVPGHGDAAHERASLRAVSSATKSSRGGKPVPSAASGARRAATVAPITATSSSRPTISNGSR